MTTASPPTPACASCHAFEHGSRWFLLGSLMVLVGAYLHIFSGHINMAPPLNVDDSLANVVMVLREEGHMGFHASPVQGSSGILRHQSFFNYGPWYFLLAAGWSWLAGLSIFSLKAIHPLVFLGLGLFFLWRCRAISLAAAGLFLPLVLITAGRTAWPMARVEIVTALLACLGFAAATVALERGSRWAWFLTGLFLGGAATSHLVAWPLIPAGLVLWLLSPSHLTGKGIDWGGMGAGLAGGGLAGVGFFWIGGFHPQELIDFLLTYHQEGVVRSSGLGYGDWLLIYLKNSAFAIPWPYLALLTGGGMAAALLAVRHPTTHDPVWLRVRSLTLPPVVGVGAYVAGLGLFSNDFSGHVILIHLGAAWGAASAAAALLELARARWPGVKPELEAGARITVALLTLTVVFHLLYRPPLYQQGAGDNTPIDAFLHHIWATIPAGAKVWGSVMFAVEESGKRTLISFGDGVMLAESLSPGPRSGILPDLLLLSPYEETYNLLAGLSGQPSIFDRLARMEPHTVYHPLRVVDAPPYGTTVLMRPDATATPAVGVPEIALAHPREVGWRTRLGPSLELSWSQVPPGKPLVNKAGWPGARLPARLSWRADLPAGDFLILAEVTAQPGEAGWLAMTAGDPDGPMMRGEWLHAHPFLNASSQVPLVARHQGGGLFLHMLAAGAAGRLDKITVFPVTGLSLRTPHLSSGEYLEQITACLAQRQAGRPPALCANP